jgi:hypothetical protein
MALAIVVADVYQVHEMSMWPTLAGEDRVVVDKLFGRGSPPRFAICVFRHRPKGTTTEPETLFVKRVLGVANEWIDFRGGDVFVGETTAVARLARPSALVESQIAAHPVLSSGSPSLQFDATGGKVTSEGSAYSFTPEGGATVVANLRVGNGPNAWDVRDDPVGAGRGRHVVPDVRVTVGAISGGAEEVAVAHELGAADVRRVAVGKDGIVVSRSGGGDVTRSAFPGAPGAGGLRLETIDGIFRVLLWEGEGWRELHAEPRADTDKAQVSRVRIEVSGGPARMASLEVNRDVHYAWSAETTAGPLPVPPDSLFLAGDNPEISTDSRDLLQFGHVPRSALVGIVRAVVWPPGRARIAR